MSKLDPISFIIANIGSLTDDEFDQLKETMIEEIACRAATEAAARAEAAFGLSLRIYGDTPLTGNAASPPPAPSLEVQPPYDHCKDIVMETVKDCMIMIAKRHGIRAAIGWAKFQENVLPPLKVRSFLWMNHDDLVETLQPIIDIVADGSFRHFKMLARTSRLLTAMEWISHKVTQADNWIPSTDDYQGELLPAAAPAPSAAPAPAPAAAPAAPSTKKARPNYNHHYWPSPRARNFAKALGHTSRNHEEALHCLASHADITVEQLMNTSPHEYAERHTPKYALSSVMPGIRRPSYY
jgi:hypothetical protein